MKKPEKVLSNDQYEKLKDCLVIGMITFRGKFVRRPNTHAWIAIRTQSGSIAVSKYRVQEVMINGKYLEVKHRIKAF